MRIRNKTMPRTMFLRWLFFFFLTIFYSEAVVRFFSVGFGKDFPVYLLLFSAALACIPALLCTICGKKVGTVFAFVSAAVVLLICTVQLVYEHIFGSFLSFSQIGMGADALTSFGKETAIGVSECIGALALLLIPIFALIWLVALGGLVCCSFSWKRTLILVAAFAALHIGTVLALPIAGTQNYAPYDVYNGTFVLGKSVRDFGVLTSLRLEVRNMLCGSGQSAVILEPVHVATETTEDATAASVPEQEYAYNITDIDFDQLTEGTTDERLLTLHKYFAAQTGTRQNEYTGMFEGYNLIVLCCESFSPYVIDAERTPTLYKMANEGFIFSDYYNTICDNTSNGEYCLCTGLLPDISLLGRGWTTFYDFNSFTAAKENSLPFCFGNQFLSLGAKTYAVHNYFCDYYGRDKTHPNMGYDFKAVYRGLEKTDDWPTSDVSMMNQTLPDLLTPDESGNIPRFHAYYLTFSGHMSYNFTSNDMAIKNKAVSDGLPYSTAVRAYISGQEELEYALEYMNEQLEAAGVADNTLIVLTADHYPYNLGLAELSTLAGKEMDDEFDKFRSALLIWSPSMAEPIKVDTPCCTLDILPTVSNLLGLSFDSRLLAGKDIFAEGEHIAILGDRSFVTDKVFYNCTTGEAILRGDALPTGYLDAKIADVKNKFTVSTEMLYSDYYSSVYPKNEE